MKKSVKIIAILIGMCAFLTAVAFAATTQPVGPQQIVWEGSSRFNESNWPPLSINAMAGNLTQLSITALSQTRTWQGYYGDISATITLDDAQNFTMYDWYDAEPQGEIYAATATVPDWSTIHCFNFSATNNTNASGNNCTAGTPGCIYNRFFYDGGTKSAWTTTYWNLTYVEESLGLARTDRDGVDETFNESGQILISRLSDGSTVFQNHTGFFVGTVNVSSGSCAATDMYETHCVNITGQATIENQYKVDDYFCNGTWDGNYTWKATDDGENFQEVLLAVNNSQVLIYATIIENDRTDNVTDPMGYNNRTWDFQMIVGENGHDDAADSSTPYFFYIELD
jgi:hypothetical protein